MIRPAATALALAASMLTACAPDQPQAVVAVRASGCSPTIERGVGVFVDDDLVLTSAHVVTGSDAISIIDHRGQERDTQIVGFDPELDLAYLAMTDDVPVAEASVAPARDLERGTPATVWVTRPEGTVRFDATIVRRVNIRTEDIYLEGSTERPGYELAYPIEPGDSGAPVFVDGEVVGVVWARSVEAGGRAYAIDVGRGSDLIHAQRAGTAELGDLTRC